MMTTPEVRKQGDGTATISGTACVFGAVYPVAGVAEDVAAGAMSATLRRGPDVLLTPEHDRSRAVARTPRTLTLRQDDVGLHYTGTVDLADGDARSIVSKIENGVYTESSFAFRCERDEWNSDYTRRTILQVSLDRGDVSVVPFGASPTTTATVERSFAGTFEQRRDVARAMSSTGWCGPWLARAPVAMPPGTRCPDCSGSGDCPRCSGTGVDDDTERSQRPRVERRPEYSDAEKAQLGKKGRAIWLDGHWAFPVANKQDYDNATAALGRTPGKNRVKVRQYLIKLAKANGWEIPANWNADGTTKTAARSSVAIPHAYTSAALNELEATLLLPASRLSRQARGPSPRDNAERNWLKHRFGARANPSRATVVENQCQSQQPPHLIGVNRLPRQFAQLRALVVGPQRDCRCHDKPPSFATVNPISTDFGNPPGGWGHRGVVLGGISTTITANFRPHTRRKSPGLPGMLARAATALVVGRLVRLHRSLRANHRAPNSGGRSRSP